MDISSAILNIYYIKGIPLEEYSDMLNSISKKYRIKLDTKKNGLLVQDLKKPTNLIMIGCIKEFFSPTLEKQCFIKNDCIDIQNRILGEYTKTTCRECYIECINKLKTNELYKINN